MPGAVVIVAGKFRDNDALQPNIHHVTNAVYRLFCTHGYDSDRIHYLATDPTLDADGDGTPDVDGLSTRENLQQAITQWAVGKVGPDRPFTLYLMDHGEYDLFFLNGYTHRLAPDVLDGWLDALETAAPGVKVNVIVDAAYSGSFIDLARTVSQVGRVVIASTGAQALAWASPDGAAFSDAFLDALASGVSLGEAFEEARWAVQASHPDQTPWLDDNGNGIANETEDGLEADQRFLFPTSGDTYEPDDACAQASFIPTDGTVQVHTFHDQDDADWVMFNATSGTTYLIEAQVPINSPADVVLELYDRCGGDPQDDQDHDFSPGVRYTFQATADGRLYLKLANHDPLVYGANVSYHLSVRALDDTPTPGAVVIVAGKIRDGDPRQRNIHHVTNAVYQLFLAHGYADSRIHYLATDVTLDPDGDGTPDVDGIPTVSNLEQAITEWAADKVGPDRPFTLYLMDHGGYDKFYLNSSSQTVSPGDVDGWLDALETAAPGVKVNVIVDACYSGSFIDLDKTVSKSGRVVITSASQNWYAYASEHGAAFSDPFLQALGSGVSLYASFQEARWAVEAEGRGQTPWLDDDGDGVPNEGEDGSEATRRGFGYPGTLGDAWSPWVVWARIGEVRDGQGVIEAEVRDDRGVSAVWAVVYPPSYRPPEEAEELVLEDLPTVTLVDADGDGVYSATYDGFDEGGAYRVVVYAVDGEGLVGRPRDVAVHRLYLPLVSR